MDDIDIDKIIVSSKVSKVINTLLVTKMMKIYTIMYCLSINECVRKKF